MTAAQNLLATTQDRQDSDLRQPDQRSYYYQQEEEEEQQERYTAGNDNHTTLASATLIPPSLGIPDSCGPVGSARSISGELSCLGDYLSHLSCGKDEYETTTTAASSTQSFSQHLHGAAGPAAVANGESNFNLQGEQDWKEDATALAVVPSALTGFGSSALASAASQAEVSTASYVSSKYFEYVKKSTNCTTPCSMDQITARHVVCREGLLFNFRGHKCSRNPTKLAVCTCRKLRRRPVSPLPSLAFRRVLVSEIVWMLRCADQHQGSCRAAAGSDVVTGTLV